MPWSKQIRQLKCTFREHPIEVLHVVNGGYPGATSALAALVAANELGIRTVMTVCSSPRDVAVPRTLEYRRDTRVDRSCDVVIVPGRRSQGRMRAVRQFGDSDVVILPWGISAPPPPTEEDRNFARMMLGVRQGAQVVGMLANFVPNKGHMALVDAIETLRLEMPRLIAVLAGDGPIRPRIQAVVKDRHLEDVIRLPGSVDDPYTLHRAADIFVLPSLVEGLPYAILEAMSQGTPVIATDVGDVGEAVTPDRNGALVEPGHPAQLVRAIERMFLDEKIRRSLGRNAQSDFERRFTYSEMMQQHAGIYEALLTDRDPGPGVCLS